MSKYEALEKSLCQELEALDQKFKSGVEMSTADLEKIDKLTHAMKSLATYNAMKEAEEWGGNLSERRARGMDGRYVSREGNSYMDGWSRGYSEAMRQSGHYPSGPWPDGMRY